MCARPWAISRAETGNGKTAVIQALASCVGATLVVQNLNVQSDSADLLGGFRPVQLRSLAHPLLVDALDAFPKLFSKSVRPRTRCVYLGRGCFRELPNHPRTCIARCADTGQRRVPACTETQL